MTLWKVDYVQINPYSRPGDKLESVEGIVMHWTGNPGGTDENHAEFFDGKDGGGSRYASAHMFIDRDSATLIIPLNEVAYHAGDIQKRNADGSPYRGVKALLPSANKKSIGVEMCVEKDGTIHPDTIARTIKVVAELVKMFNLDPLKDIYRHYDVTAKNCPAPWVSNPQLFTNFKAAVNSLVNKNGWLKENNNWFYYENGVKKTGWKQINGKWYFFDINGIMKTGWVQSSSRWFYLSSQGAMVTGWLNYENKWYFLNADGSMENMGWKEINGKWYFFYRNGEMAVNTMIGQWKIGSDGAWIK